MGGLFATQPSGSGERKHAARRARMNERISAGSGNQKEKAPKREPSPFGREESRFFALFELRSARWDPALFGNHRSPVVAPSRQTPTVRMRFSASIRAPKGAPIRARSKPQRENMEAPLVPQGGTTWLREQKTQLRVGGIPWSEQCMCLHGSSDYFRGLLPLPVVEELFSGIQLIALRSYLKPFAFLS